MCFTGRDKNQKKLSAALTLLSAILPAMTPFAVFEYHVSDIYDLDVICTQTAVLTQS